MDNSFNYCLQPFPTTVSMTRGYLFKLCCEYNKGLRQTRHSVTRGHLVHQIISNITTNMTHIHIYMETKTDGLLKTSNTLPSRDNARCCGDPEAGGNKLWESFWCCDSFSTDGHFVAQRLNNECCTFCVCEKDFFQV